MTYGFGAISLWDSGRRIEFLISHGWAPGSSHNLWFQLIGAGGLLALGGGVVLVATMANQAFKSGNVLLIGSILALVILRGITEVTLDLDVLSETFLIQAALLAWLGYESTVQDETSKCAHR